MKLTCDRESFWAAFNVASSVAPSRSTRTVLQDVLLAADGPDVWLIGTDLEIGCRAAVAGCEVREPGRSMVPVEKMRRLLGASDDERLTIESADRMLKVSGAASEHEWPTEDPAIFPEPPGFDVQDCHVVEARDLKRLIRRTAFATAKIDRMAHEGVLCQRYPDRLVFTGADGRRLARQSVPATVQGRPAWAGQVVLQEKMLRTLERHLDDGDPPVRLAFTENDAVVRTASAAIWSRQVVGRFMVFDEDMLMPSAVTVEVAAGAIRRAVEEAAIATDEATKALDLRFGGGRLRVNGSAEAGRSRVEVPIPHDGDPFAVRLAREVLPPWLKAIGDDRAVTVSLAGDRDIPTFAALENNAARQELSLRTQDGGLYVLSTMGTR